MTNPTQADVLQWAVDSFGLVAKNVDERAARLVEEAIEIAQVHGVKPETITKITQRVYSRPCGEIGQEVGGCGITLLALAENCGVDFEAEILREWERVSALPREYWARKHGEKVAAGTANLTPTQRHDPDCSIHGVFDPALQGDNPPELGRSCNCGSMPPVATPLYQHASWCASWGNFDKTKPDGGVRCDCGAADIMNANLKDAETMASNLTHTGFMAPVGVAALTPPSRRPQGFIDCESCGLSHPMNMRCPESYP